MFSKSDKTAHSAPSFLSANMQAHGNFTTDGEIQIDGSVEGDVSAAKLTLGEHAKIAGHIRADEAIIRGEVRGSIHARTVHIAKSARVTGDVWHEVLSIEAGAYIEGQCKHSEAPRETEDLKLLTAEPPKVIHSKVAAPATHHFSATSA
ncbi:MAG: polymer-forming cytoskeletal protein [Pseudomonadota bacterium]